MGKELKGLNDSAKHKPEEEEIAGAEREEDEEEIAFGLPLEW